MRAAPRPLTVPRGAYLYRQQQSRSRLLAHCSSSSILYKVHQSESFRLRVGPAEIMDFPGINAAVRYTY